MYAFAIGVAAALALTGAQGAEAADLVLGADAGPYVEARINGVPLRLELDHEQGIALNAAAAARAGLGRGDGKWTLMIGRVKLRGRSAETAVEIAGSSVRTTAHWLDRDAAADADGVISPALLPFDRVTLQRRIPNLGEREITFTTKFNNSHGIHMPLTFGKRRIAARFSLLRPRSIAPAAAGAVIAAFHGGSLEKREVRNSSATA